MGHMSPDDQDLLALAAAISDGETPDWEDESTGGISRDGLIRSLRIVAAVADLHRIAQRDLLAPSSGAGSAADSSVSSPGSIRNDGGVSQPSVPNEIGRYRILRLIAQGGMGAVYEAEQDRPRRTVALKVIRPGLASVSVLRRFELESQVLARLQHPGIAQIYDAGTADFGFGTQPFFAMELIRGRGLLQYAVEGRLDVQARIELLAKVADAIEHAHQKGIIHRDLKSANILVDEAGQPKVLDFGVARATDSDVQATMGTDIGQLVGTLSYMSPEQIAGDPAAIDPRSDVYTLGVVLYELLTGRLPYETAGKTIPELAQVIRDREPTRLSSIDKFYRGDVETIVAKALEKEKERRYASAADFAEDLRRYLRGEPIAARQPTTLYQIRKFARRNPGLVLGLAIAFLALVAGIIGTTAGLIRARQQRDIANAQQLIAKSNEKTARRETQRAQLLNGFMQNLLGAARPGTMGTGRDVRVADVLDSAGSDLPTRFKDEPELEMEARSTLGQTYLSLGLYEEATANLERALELAKRYRPEESEDRLLIADRLAWSMCASGQAWDKSEQLSLSTLAVARRVLGAKHPLTLSMMNTLSLTYCFQWKGDQAEPILEELLSELRALPRESRPVPISAVMARLANLQYGWGHAEAGEALAREALEAAKSDEVSPLDDVIQRTTVTVATILALQNRLDEAEPLYRQALDRARQTLGRSHSEAVRIGFDLSAYYWRTNRPSEAYDLSREWLDYSRSHFWKVGAWKESGERDKTWLLSTVALYAAGAGKFREAGDLYAEAITVLRKDRGDADAEVQDYWRNLSMVVGLKILGPWGSDAIRNHVHRLVRNALFDRPSTSLRADELQWDRLRFRLIRWPSGVTEGNLEKLRSMSDPEPGLYLLSMHVPRLGGAPVAGSVWMLVGPWDVELYRLFFKRPHVPREELIRSGDKALRGKEEEFWKQRLESPPDERRREPSLALQGWSATRMGGLGPKNLDYNFGFAARTTLRLPAGSYRFLVTMDDGARLWIDDRLIVDSWKINPETTNTSAVVELSEGPHACRVDYLQDSGPSRIFVSAEPLDPAVVQVKAAAFEAR